MTSLNSLLYCPCILGVGFARSDRLHAHPVQCLDDN